MEPETSSGTASPKESIRRSSTSDGTRNASAPAIRLWPTSRRRSGLTRWHGRQRGTSPPGPPPRNKCRSWSPSRPAGSARRNSHSRGWLLDDGPCICASPFPGFSTRSSTPSTTTSSVRAFEHAWCLTPDGRVADPAIPDGWVLGSVFKDHQVVDHGRVIRRHELTDLEWELLAPLIPRAATGRPRVPDRQVINGMVYKIRTGVSRRDLPERYGPWQTVCTRFRRCALDGVFTRALQQIQADADAAGDIDWLVQIDSTIVRAHQHAAATGRKGGSTGRTNRTITPSADPEAD
ncbi:transposase [Streptomyces triticiradicis]|uniref:Transposase n=1 Tax=Streptomyces triticiradicis TaxID=2651189 RepID=A0A7J5D9A0_9ACTN|nr:transposase [Streptomyces triticiradicis]